jgi:hypothetical protein
VATVGNIGHWRVSQREMTEIQCRCGAVAVAVTGAPMAQFFCHCDDCQAVHGAAYVPVSLYPADAVTLIRGEPTAWKLRSMARRTCPTCGTRVFAAPEGLGFCGVSGALLPPGTFHPRFHIQCKFAMRPIRDDLPRYRCLPSMFRWHR